ncbi:MAG: hypothetical protein QM742_19900 [Aquabacterium sp.]
MEKHTQTVSVYVGADASAVLSCLADLRQLKRWTLGTCVHEQVSDDTWVGEVSSTTQPVYFKVVRMVDDTMPMIEWHCGRQPDALHVVHRLCLLPSAHGGVHVQWLSFLRPGACGALASQGFDVLAHRAEGLRLKAVLEREAGLAGPALADEAVLSASIYIDAQADVLMRHLGDLGQAHRWGAAWQVVSSPSPQQARYLDAYGRGFEATASPADHGPWGASVLMATTMDMPHADPWSPPRWQLWMAMPCAHVLGVEEARGSILVRSAVVPCKAGTQPDSALALMRGECMVFKRQMEGLAGCSQRFADGLSYAPPSSMPSR